jgi:hypothetical protein
LGSRGVRLRREFKNTAHLINTLLQQGAGPSTARILPGRGDEALISSFPLFQFEPRYLGCYGFGMDRFFYLPRPPFDFIRVNSFSDLS